MLFALKISTNEYIKHQATGFKFDESFWDYLAKVSLYATQKPMKLVNIAFGLSAFISLCD